MNEAEDTTDAIVADLWHFYDEHATQARQHESLRATVTGTLAAIAAAVMALAGIGGLSAADIPAGLIVVLVGVLGVALNLKHFERNRWHADVMWAVQAEIERLRAPRLAAAQPMSVLWRTTKETHAAEFSVRRRGDRLGESKLVDLRLYMPWVWLALGIAIVGVLMIVLSLIGVSEI